MKLGTRGIHGVLLAGLVGGFVIAGCGDSEEGGSQIGGSVANGGSSGVSGSNAGGAITGGTTSGGTTSAGGTTSGGTSSGGTTTTAGGTTSVGGTTSTGGTSTGTGGTTTSTGGTSTGVGGTFSTGGTTGSGGCGTTQCTNCLDDDHDGKIDSADQECTGAADNDEGTFATGIPGDNQDPFWQDCFFDGNSGAGDDGCRYHTECLTGQRPQTDPSCQVSQQCIDFCMQYVPNGCDCFGCCSVTVDGVTKNVTLLPTCTTDKINDPTACPTCTKSTLCGNDCAHCELCLGKTTLPDDCVTSGTGGTGGSGGSTGGSGGTGGSVCPTPICPFDRQPCGVSCLPGCPTGLYCLTGCCTTSPA